MKSTAGCAVGLLGLDEVNKLPENIPIYVCEGEWDGIALNWLLKFLKEPGYAVAVPGAAIFKREWISFFQRRNVICCYDHDDAGRNGELVAQERLTGVAKSIRYIHWPVELPVGYDIRDLIVEKAIRNQKPKTTLLYIKDKLRDMPRDYKPDSLTTPAPVISADTPAPPKTTLSQVFETFGKWLYLKDFRGIEIALATIVSNEMEGDPLWMFLVSSPGGAKTEILQACNKCSNVYVTSSMTSHALISGANFINGKDPSLLPHLHGKTLIVKDFTTVLTKKEAEKEEIFGIFRDAYDGHSGKVFGNGQRREYTSHFSIIAGVTPVIHELAAQHQTFGERFLKFSLGDNLDHPFESEMINQSIDNVGSENLMRQELSNVVQEFMNYQIWQVKQFRPEIPEDIKDKLMHLARFGARMRGNVSRDRYRSDIMSSKPAAEYGTRLAKQLAKLMKALAYVNHRKVVTMNDYETAKKTMLDTISQRVEDVLKSLYRATPTIDDTLKTKDVAVKTKYTTSTISHILADLDILGIVLKGGKQNAFEWTISPYIRSLIEKASIYKSTKEG
jgi:hypothetical protein